MENPGFCQGAIAGIAVAGIVGFLLQQILFQYRKMQAPKRPMRTFPPDDTPAKVVRTSREAGCVLAALVGVLAFLLFLVAYVVFNSLA